MSTRPTATAWLVLLLLGACGAEPGGLAPNAEYEDPHGVAGVYAMDVARTTGGTTTDADGNEVDLSDAVLERLEAGHGADSLRLELRTDGTFELFQEMGEEDFRTGGSWKETGAGVELVTTTVNGEPAPKEAAYTEVYQRERGYLVVEQAGVRIYMKKQTRAP